MLPLLMAAGVTRGLTSSNPLTKALGLDGGQGEYFQGRNSNAALDDINSRNSIYGNAGVNAGIQGYGNGSMSLQDALSSGNLQGSQQNEMRNALAIDPITGSRMASQAVQSDPLTGRLFGAGNESAMSQALAEQSNLRNKGFQLTGEDHEAYGQASGDIARMFGQQENDLTQSLASRGLASGASGAAGAGFSGLQGNKYEQLGKAQMGIAQRRMDNTTQRLQMANQNVQSLGGLQNTAHQDQYGRQLAGVKQQRGQLETGAQLQNQANSIYNDSGYNSMQDKRDAKGKTLMQGLGQGLLHSSAAVGKIPGQYAASQAGGASGGR